jgi:hypothetical protein
VLREADLVSVRSEGNRRLYRVRADRLAELRAMLDEFWGSRLAGLQAELSGSGLSGSGLAGSGVSEREGGGG